MGLACSSPPRLPTKVQPKSWTGGAGFETGPGESGGGGAGEGEGCWGLPGSPGKINDLFTKNKVKTLPISQDTYASLSCGAHRTWWAALHSDATAHDAVGTTLRGTAVSLLRWSN